METDADREPRDAVRSALARAEFLLAYDEARQALDTAPRDVVLQYYAVLALARAGATDRAQEELERLDLDRTGEADRSAELSEDIAALRARIAKDRALGVSGSLRRARARRSAELYEAIFARLQRPYACINAATMWLVAGDEQRSRALAGSALDLARSTRPLTVEDAYWLAATEAEVALLLGDPDPATDVLARAVAASVPAPAARATTLKQLSLVCEAQRIDPHVLAPLRLPPVVHYCGHMIRPPGRLGPFTADQESLVAAGIAEYLDSKRPSVAFGSLACGADILFAEALVARGTPLHVVLPFGQERFKDVSVRHAGADWPRRFDACLARAGSVSYATDGDSSDAAALFDYAARIAMGRAIIQARFLCAEVEQVAVWDRVPMSALGGTASNIDAWQQNGRRKTHMIALPDVLTSHDPTIPPPTSATPLRAMLFTDVKGFSRLHDEQVRPFLGEVLAPLGRVLDRFSDDILYRNSWGDGMYVVLRDVATAARCAAVLQDTMQALDLRSVGLPPDLGLRIGGHAGPVVEAEDPIRHERNFYGDCVTRTARLEPRTPEGSIYVTEEFAALLALEAFDEIRCQYVGHIPAAKDYGTFRMYSLTPPE